MFDVDIRVLDCFSGVSKTGNAFSIVTFRVGDGRDQKCFSKVDLSEYKGDSVGVVCNLVPNREGFAGIEIVGLGK